MSIKEKRFDKTTFLLAFGSISNIPLPSLSLLSFSFSDGSTVGNAGTGKIVSFIPLMNFFLCYVGWWGDGGRVRKGIYI